MNFSTHKIQHRERNFITYRLLIYLSYFDLFLTFIVNVLNQLGLHFIQLAVFYP